MTYILNQLNVGEIIDLYKETSKMIGVLQNLRVKKIREIDHTSRIEELIQTYDVTYRLTLDDVSLTTGKSFYRKGGTNWNLRFSKKYHNHIYNFATISYFSVDISHIPSNLDFGSRINVTFNVNRIRCSLHDQFFKQFIITRNQMMNELATLKFEDPLLIAEILLFIEDKMVV